MKLLFCSLVVLASIGSCSNETGPEPAECADAGVKDFGDECGDPCECASAICFEFGDGTRSCTTDCTDDADCPAGSRGQKCNEQGVCRS